MKHGLSIPRLALSYLGMLLIVLTIILWPDPSHAAPDWSGTGHFVTEAIGYTPSPYTVQPNFRQDSSITDTATSDISSADNADLFVNFDFDTTGKFIYLVYTTDGSAPNKTNGTSVAAAFSNFSTPNRTWRASVPAQPAGTVVNYVFYASDSTLALGWGRISGTPADRNVSQFQTSWTEDDSAYFSYTVTTPLAISLGWFRTMPEDDDVQFLWQTATESGVAGFNLFMDTEHGRQPINMEMRPSRAIDSVAPQTYGYRASVSGERFYLQEVGVTGVVTEHGPFDLGVEYGAYTSANPFDWPHTSFIPVLAR